MRALLEDPARRRQPRPRGGLRALRRRARLRRGAGPPHRPAEDRHDAPAASGAGRARPSIAFVHRRHGGAEAAACWALRRFAASGALALPLWRRRLVRRLRALAAAQPAARAAGRRQRREHRGDARRLLAGPRRRRRAGSPGGWRSWRGGSTASWRPCGSSSASAGRTSGSPRATPSPRGTSPGSGRRTSTGGWRRSPAPRASTGRSAGSTPTRCTRAFADGARGRERADAAARAAGRRRGGGARRRSGASSAAARHAAPRPPARRAGAAAEPPRRGENVWRLRRDGSPLRLEPGSEAALGARFAAGQPRARGRGAARLGALSRRVNTFIDRLQIDRQCHKL